MASNKKTLDKINEGWDQSR